MSTTTETITRVICPHCFKPAGRIDHLLDSKRQWGSWYCDHCGGAYEGTVDGQAVTVKARAERRIKTLEVLQLEGGTLVLIVEGMRFESHGEQGKDQSYFYDEHTCPENYHRAVAAVWELCGTDEQQIEDDPHGVYSYIGGIDLEQGESGRDAVERLEPQLKALLGVESC